MKGILLGVLLGLLIYLFVVEPWQSRLKAKREVKVVRVVNCRRAPKGYICTYTKDHDGVCEAVRERRPVHFLRRSETGQLERLVTDGKWVGWVSAEIGTRGWIIWQAIAKARGI